MDPGALTTLSAPMMTDPLAGLQRPFVLLEDRLGGGPARLFRGPVAVVSTDTAEAVDAALARVEAGLAQGLHAAGFLSYELGYALEPHLRRLMPPRRDQPLLWLGLFDAPQIIDPAALDSAFAQLAPPPPLGGLAAGLSARAHANKVDQILSLIGLGDIYQANLTFPLRFDYNGEPLALYAALRAAQPVAFGGVVALDDLTVLSVSPELWVRTVGGQAAARPMKGTAARLADPGADDQARAALAADPKQRAENLMITDLLRNDLSRIARTGTVRTPALFTVESYPSFHALTSTVTATLRPEVGLRERLAALFPCGSVVGAPKIRAGEVIAEVETAPRGVYTGGVGSLAPDGDMAFNVAIRTAVIAGGQGVYGVGGGIVADSQAPAEYAEALLKGRVLTDLAQDYQLIETFRWTPAGFQRLDEHLARLAGSAAALGFSFDGAGARARLSQAAAGWRAIDQRVRLALARDGDLGLTHEPITASQPALLKVGLAAARLDRGDPFLRHKTTHRAIYDDAFAVAASRGLDEALFLNREGLVAEASRNSVFVQREGRLLTPPVSVGLLPGVLRATLLQTGAAVEAMLTLEDLTTAEAWFVGNSLHGLRPATLI